MALDAFKLDKHLGNRLNDFCSSLITVISPNYIQHSDSFIIRHFLHINVNLLQTYWVKSAEPVYRWLGAEDLMSSVAAFNTDLHNLISFRRSLSIVISFSILVLGEWYSKNVKMILCLSIRSNICTQRCWSWCFHTAPISATLKY